MKNRFKPCLLPWAIWPWGLSLSHSDTDVGPKCTVEFGAQVARPTPPFDQYWVRVVFAMADVVIARPKSDIADLADVTDYDFEVDADRGESAHHADINRWLESGECPHPGFYWASKSTLLESEVEAQGSIHFLLEGRDGYLEILADGFSWSAWPQGHPRLDQVTGEPVLTGRWTRPQAEDAGPATNGPAL
jgi:hypothetical protein